MTVGELFYQTIGAHWYEWKEKNRKNAKYVKVLNPEFASMTGADASSNVSVILVDKDMNVGANRIHYNKIKSLRYATATLSYYKLFNNCTVIEDEEKLSKLKILEAKLYLIGAK